MDGKRDELVRVFGGQFGSPEVERILFDEVLLQTRRNLDDASMRLLDII